MEFSEAIDGTVGLESLFGALNSILNPIEFIEAITIKPRQRFGITIPIIAEGSEADLTLFNPEGNYTFSTSDLLSTSKNSIFIDKKLKGSVYGIIAKNQLILKQ